MANTYNKGQNNLDELIEGIDYRIVEIKTPIMRGSWKVYITEKAKKADEGISLYDYLESISGIPSTNMVSS